MFFSKHKAEIVLACSAALWGLFWIPLRAFERNGLDPGWATILQFVVPLLIMLPFAVYYLIRGKDIGLNQWITGLLIGSAFALYCESLLLTDVVRALILFYVAPAWGTLLEVFVMGRRFTLWRALALLLSLFGLICILSAGADQSVPFNLGDAMAFLSGIIFCIGAMRVRQSPDVSVFSQLFAFFLYGAIFAYFLSLLPFAEIGTAPSMETMTNLIWWLLLMAIGFLVPVMGGIYWGSKRVDPGRLGILLQCEAIVGIISAALFAGEPFGLLEGFGAVLVISAGLVEVLGNKSPESTNQQLAS